MRAEPGVSSCNALVRIAISEEVPVCRRLQTAFEDFPTRRWTAI
jgi:hypothetical protein